MPCDLWIEIAHLPRGEGDTCGGGARVEERERFVDGGGSRELEPFEVQGLKY